MGNFKTARSLWWWVLLPLLGSGGWTAILSLFLSLSPSLSLTTLDRFPILIIICSMHYVSSSKRTLSNHHSEIEMSGLALQIRLSKTSSHPSSPPAQQCATTSTTTKTPSGSMRYRIPTTIPNHAPPYLEWTRCPLSYWKKFEISNHAKLR